MTEAYRTREEWLTRGAELLAEHLLGPAGLDTNAETEEPLLERLRVGPSMPSVRALARKQRAIGQCWSIKASTDGTTEIFVSPTVDDPMIILPTLLHEMVHAAVGPAAGHGIEFKRACVRVGLAGPATATFPGENLITQLAEIAAELGEYPHKKMDPAATMKKQTTRLLKAVCDSGHADAATCPGDYRAGDAYVLRITASQAARGMPYCGICDEVMTLLRKDAEEEEPEEPPEEKPEPEEPEKEETGDCEEDGGGQDEEPENEEEEEEEEEEGEEPDAWEEYQEIQKELTGESLPPHAIDLPPHAIDPDCGCERCEAELTKAGLR